MLIEVGTGSGYGAALVAEVVGASGKVVTIEIDEETYRFARSNLDKLVYGRVLTVGRRITGLSSSRALRQDLCHCRLSEDSGPLDSPTIG